MKKNTLFIAGSMLLAANSVNAQCTISGLDTVYCSNDALVNMGTMGNGFGAFSGPGVTGSDFDPAVAGVGMHTVMYSEVDSNSYIIDQGGVFAPLASPISGTQVSLSDDQTSAALPIGFTFNFFGTDYTNFYISSNGYIGFSAGMGNGCCSGSTIPTPAGGEDNLIAFAWDDLDPGNGGQPAINLVQYVLTGTAPNQVLVMEFYNVDHYSSGSPVSSQVHLYETSNIIEIHTTSMPNDGSNHTQGIENVDGSIGFAVPGRNANGAWSLTNDYVAFIPDTCVSTLNVEVLALPTVIGVADFNAVCDGEAVVLTSSGADSVLTWDNGVMDGISFVPVSTMDYTVTGYDSTGCSNTAVVNVAVNPNPTATFVGTDEMSGNDGSIVSTPAGGTAPYTYDWDNDGTGDFDDAADLTGVVAGTYTVVVMDANGCLYTEAITIGSQVSIDEIEGLEFSIFPNPSAGVFQITFVSEANNLTYEVVNSLGQVILYERITSNVVDVNISGNESGIYYVKIISETGTSVKSIILK